MYHLRRGMFLVAACAVLLTACSKAPADVSSAPVSVPNAPGSKTDAPPKSEPVPEVKEPTVDDLNDQAFAFIKAQNWQGAIDVANEALALDQESSAAWFNLGRGQLGAGKAKEAAVAFARASGLLEKEPNVDVEFFLATALEASGQPMWALSVYERALEQWPDDPDLPRAIADLKLQNDVEILEPTDSVDLDGDGKPDLIEVTPELVRLTSADGVVLAEQRVDVPNNGPRVKIYPMRNTRPLVQIEWLAVCPSAGWNTFLWYDWYNQKMIVADEGGMCLSYRYIGNGRFESYARLAGGDLQVDTYYWNVGQWVDLGTEIRPFEK